MHNAAGHMAILAGAALAAYVLSLAIAPDRQAGKTPTDDSTVVVVTLPQRPGGPATKAPTPQQLPASTPPRDSHGSLARQLQGELKRVGCYDGEINGVWTTSTRLAMIAFTERVNAKLPIDKPDHILLALVQGQQERVCAAPCGAGQTQRAGGRCGAEVVLAKAPNGPEAADAGSARTTNSPGAALPVIAAPPRLISPPTEAVRAAAPPKFEQNPTAPTSAKDPPRPAAPLVQEPPSRDVPLERPQRTARQSGPVPSLGVYERRLRQFSRRAPSQQMVYARSLIRDLKRAVKTALPLP